MLEQLIERLALRIAKAEYWKINSDETQRANKSRLKQSRKIAELCLQEIDDFLHEEDINFDELEISERSILSEILDELHH